MNRNTLLIIVMLIFFGVSGVILYRNFFGAPRGYVPGRGFTQTESGVSVTGVAVLEAEVDKVSRSLEADGIWSGIADNEQFKNLSDEAFLPIVVGEHGNRSNPFEPIKFGEPEP